MPPTLRVQSGGELWDLVGGPCSPPLARCPLPRHYVVLFPSVLYYPYTGKVHVHLMDLDEPVQVTFHLASSHGIPNITLEVQGSDILQLNWPRFSNVSNGPTVELRTSGRGIYHLPIARAGLGELGGDMGPILDGQQVS